VSCAIDGDALLAIVFLTSHVAMIIIGTVVVLATGPTRQSRAAESADAPRTEALIQKGFQDV
jgi:hypothetical protein